MATSAGEIEVILSLVGKEFNESLKRIEDKLSDTESGMKKFGATIAGVFSAKQLFDFAKEAVTAFGEQEIAVLKLTRAVGKDAANALVEYADALQAQTTFTNDSILAMSNQLANFGLYPGTIKAATKPIMDFAAATGKDLTEATNVFGQALAGNSRELKKYGLVLDENDTRAERLQKTTDLMTQKFSGMAEQMTGTTLGSIENLKNRLDDLKKKIGQELVPVVTTWVNWLSKATGFVEKLTGANKNDMSVRDMQIDQLKRHNQSIGLALKGYSEYRNELVKTMGVNALDDEFLRKRLIQNTNLIVQLQQKAALEKANSQQRAADIILETGIVDNEINEQTKAFRKLAEAENAARDATVERMLTGNIVKIQSANDLMRAEIYAASQSFEAQASLGEQLNASLTVSLLKTKAVFADMILNTMNSFADGLTTMILDGKKFSEVMKQIWKDLARAMIQEIIRIIVKMIALLAIRTALGMPTGGALGIARLAVSGGFAEGGVINEPSLITGLRSGKTVLAGEAGAEAVVPLGGGGGGRNKSAAEMGTSFAGMLDGGGEVNLTVNISGQFLEGNENMWQRMFREKILPEVKRVTMTNPTGNFIRRRGATA